MTSSYISRRNFLKGAGAAGLLGAAAPLLAACSPDASSEGSSAASGATAITAVAYNGNPPYCYLDDSGELQGYDVEVLKACAEKLTDYDFTFEAMDFTAMITACESGAAEVVTCCLVPSEERKEKFLFCEEPLCLCPMVFAVADPAIKTMDDLAGKTVLIETASYEYGMLTAYNEKYPDKALNLQTIENCTVADAFKKVASGQVDAYSCYNDTFDTVNEEAGTGLSKTDVVLCESTYFMFNIDQEDLCKAVNDALIELKEDGTVTDIAIKYLGVDVFTEYADALTDNEIING